MSNSANRPVMKTRICDLLNIEYPVLCAGMGSFFFPLPAVTGARLAAAVSEAGGMGVLGAGMMTLDEMRQAIRDVRKATDKPFGVDLILPANIDQHARDIQALSDITFDAIKEMMPTDQLEFLAALKKELGIGDHPVVLKQDLTTFRPKDAVDICLEERVPVFVAGLGNPSFMISDAHAQGMVVMGLVGNVKNAKRIVESGVDVVIAQGTEAGGHTGRVGTLALIPQVVDAVSPVPVLGAGGIGDGRGLAAALSLGADGVWVGTAFIATEEADEYDFNKQKLIDADEEGTRVTKVFTGKTMRGIQNELIRRWEDAGLQTLPMPLQTFLMAELTEGIIAERKIDYISGPGGQVAGMISGVRTAKEVLSDIVTGAIAVLREELPRRVSMEESGG
ncbi:MAG: nitronate monooxygenase [Deltaproteobacteria bacterium]|nr:nitronate monooxygenase [Candidatus Zymogenaceae bacterium]